MNLTAKIYIAGHRGLVDSALMRNLQAKGYINRYRDFKYNEVLFVFARRAKQNAGQDPEAAAKLATVRAGFGRVLKPRS